MIQGGFHLRYVEAKRFSLLALLALLLFIGLTFVPNIEQGIVTVC